MSNRIDLTGKTFGRLTVTGNIERRNNLLYWECVCECGNNKFISSAKLRSGNTKSCRCLNTELTIKRTVTHGLSKHPIHKLWLKIKERCYNPNSENYYMYGGRGVIMCKEWLNDFMCFYNWCVANGWAKGLQIDKDIKAIKIGIPALVYSPEMCQFVTPKVNNYSKRTSKYIEYNGKKQTIAEWAVETGIKMGTLWRRLRKTNWSTEDILTKKIIYANKTVR